MSEKVIVLVSDRGDSKHGEISIVEDPHKAERLVETLLEAGFEQERIHVFTGKESDFQVSQRPVVALVAEGEEEEPQVGVAGPDAAAAEPTPDIAAAEPAPDDAAAEPLPDAAATEPVPDAEETEIGGKQGEESETKEEVTATAETASPVKFSSLFRSA